MGLAYIHQSPRFEHDDLLNNSSYNPSPHISSQPYFDDHGLGLDGDGSSGGDGGTEYDLHTSHEYSEKELDDALRFLDLRRRSTVVNSKNGGTSSRASVHSFPTTTTMSGGRPMKRSPHFTHYVRLCRSFLTKRGILIILIGAATAALVTRSLLSSTSVANEDVGRASVAGGGAASRLRRPLEQARGLLKGFASPFSSYSNKEENVVPPVHMRRTDVLKYDTPQAKFKDNLKENLRYITALAYGGHANQMIGIGKLLYLAQLTDRVPVIPTLIPVHFNAGPANFSTFYDLPRFFLESSIPAVEMSMLKPIDASGTAPQNERVSCWSTQEVTAGHPNLFAVSLDVHDVWVDYWPLPPMERGLGGFDIAFDAMRIFDFNWESRNRWIDRVRREALPQQAGEFTGDKAANLKPGFDTLKTKAPDEHFLCLDNPLFLGPIMFPAIKVGELPHEDSVPGEGLSWKAANQFIHFTPLVESRADEYLMRLFGVTSPSRIPPFISVHLRRGDFKEFTGLTALDKYASAVARIRSGLQKRIDDPEHWQGPGRKHFKSFGMPASKYAVLTTTDEPTGSAFIDEVRALGWKVLDHGEERFKTEEKFGGWWPTILDSAILARGKSFVGTDKSTFSHIAGLRVKYWNGGLVDVAI